MRLALAVLLVASPLLAQQPAIPAVDSIFAIVDKGDSPGCALGVYRDGQMVYSRGYGMANLELGVPLTPRSVFDIGSTAKQFTATSIVLLSQDGRLTLDDDIHKWIPELPDYGKRITIRHLLTHTSGIRDYIGLLWLAGADYDDVTTEQEALDVIVRQRALNFPPGEEYLYSNSGYFLAGLIVKRASGKSIREFAAERIFQPLGMIHTRFREDHAEPVPERSSAYAPQPDGGYRIDMPNWEQLGDGGIVTTVEDLLKWDSNFYLPKVGGTALLETLQTNAKLNSGKPISYALGLQVAPYRGVQSVSHGGSWGGYRAELFRIPSLHFSAAVLCNVPTGQPGASARRVADVMLAGKLGPVSATAADEGDESTKPADVPVRLTPDEMKRYAGWYYATELDVTITIGARGDSLSFERPRAPVLLLGPAKQNQFRGEDFSIQFQRTNGKPSAFLLDMGRTRALSFVRVAKK